MQKKSQAHTQIMMYIFAMIIVSAVLLYGYQAVKGFMSQTKTVALIQFKNDFAATVETSTGYGSVTKKVLDVPAEYTKICFVDREHSSQAEQTDLCDSLDITAYEPLICDAWKSSDPANVFFVDKLMKGSFNVNYLRVPDPGWLCLTPVNGRITLRLEGQGSYTLVSSWQ